MITPVPAGDCRSITRISKLETVNVPMGNRHHNKKLRAAARAAQTTTGESYQTVLSRLRRERASSRAPARDVDLIPIEYFGLPMTLATFEILENLSCVVTSVNQLRQPFPKSPLFALAGQRFVS